MLRFTPIAGLLFLCGIALAAPQTVITLQPPGRNEYANIDPAGTSVIPSGRYLGPAGKSVRITHDPFGLAISPDGKTAICLHNKVITVIETGNPEKAVRYPSYDGSLSSPVADGSFLGVAFSPDGKTVYLSGGNTGEVVYFDLSSGKSAARVSINGEFAGQEFKDSFSGDLAVSRDGKRIYVIDRANFRLVKLDVDQRKVAGSVKVGRLPLGLALSHDEKKAYVANVGLFEYPLVPGVTPEGGEMNMLPYPPYGIPSREAEEGVDFQGRKMPGLGSPHVPEAMSVWVANLEAGTITAKLKTGHQIGEVVEGLEVVGGSSPNSLAVGEDFVYVSNATNDSISVIDARENRIVDHIRLNVDPRIDRWRGLMPFGLALTKDGTHLYVALLTLNAIAVVDTQKRGVTGLIPTGWCPTRVALSPDEKTLYTITARGYGAGPNGGKDFTAPVQGTYVGDIQLGSFHTIPVPTDGELAEYTRQAIENTFREVEVTEDGNNPLPPAPGLRESPIRYVVYVTKENRTYDEVFGELEGSKGDPTLARFGIKAIVKGEGGKEITEVNVAPNHQRIARQWTISDNFYCDSDASVHGHRWMIGHIPNEWMEANTAHSRDFLPFSAAPGRRFPDSSGGIDPEDYNETGGMFEHLHRNGLSFINFGQSTEFGGVFEEWNHTDTGIRMPVIFPMSKPVYDRTCWTYAGYNMNVPDQYRMDSFEQVMTERYLSGKEPFPRLIAIQIPNDHLAGPRPQAGYPFHVSRTPQWHEMVVIIVEDDPQGGVDHIDAHRSILLMAGPYIKRGYVSHTHANFGAVLKTIYLLLDIPPVNQFDAAATLLQDFFTETPDFTPYSVEQVDSRIFDPQAAMDVYDRTFDWRRITGGPKLDNPDEQRDEHYRQNGK